MRKVLKPQLLQHKQAGDYLSSESGAGANKSVKDIADNGMNHTQCVKGTTVLSIKKSSKGVPQLSAPGPVNLHILVTKILITLCMWGQLFLSELFTKSKPRTKPVF